MNAIRCLRVPEIEEAVKFFNSIDTNEIVSVVLDNEDVYYLMEYLATVSISPRIKAQIWTPEFKSYLSGRLGLS